VDKLQNARASKVINNLGKTVELTWEDIIGVAKDDKYALKLTGERIPGEAPSAPSSQFKPP
jgi:hypothetical protein